MPTKLLIVGGGSFATEVEELARLVGYDEIAFLDDDAAHAQARPVIGSMQELEKYRAQYDHAIVALGNNSNRMRYHEMLESMQYHIPALIHPTAYVSPDAQLAPGCIVRTFAVVGRYAQLGKATILNIGAKVDHHCIIGEGCHLLINAVVRASRTVEPLTWVEAGRIIQ
ncbi:MAG: hypothetical protein ACI4L8_12995 [Candidatus Fimadaptatus sp.]